MYAFFYKRTYNNVVLHVIQNHISQSNVKHLSDQHTKVTTRSTEQSSCGNYSKKQETINHLHAINITKYNHI